MFLGEYQLTFTGKGRIILPKKLRDKLSKDEVVLSRGFEGCVLGFDSKKWEEEADKQLEVSVTDEKGRFLKRYFFSASEFISLDNQGRFVIPESLLKFANLEKKVAIIGAGDHFEIWEKDAWQRHIKSIEEAYGRVS